MLFLLMFRFVRSLLSGHQAVALEDAGLPNTNLRFSAKAAAADNPGPGVFLDYSPEPIGRLAPAVVLRSARHRCAMTAQTLPEVWAWLSKPQRRVQGPLHPAELRRLIAQMIAFYALWRAPRIHGVKMLGIAISGVDVSHPST